jgi:hypothetical protein
VSLGSSSKDSGFYSNPKPLYFVDDNPIDNQPQHQAYRDHDLEEERLRDNIAELTARGNGGGSEAYEYARYLGKICTFIIRPYVLFLAGHTDEFF